MHTYGYASNGPHTCTQDEKEYDEVGRIDIDLLKAHLPFGDFDFYLRGPPAFMQSLYDGLRGLRISDDRIHAEAFGPSALKRRCESAESATRAVHPPATGAVTVVFTGSSKETMWVPEGGTLLEVAEQCGLSPAYSCRAGNCGECRTNVIKGGVSYLYEPSYSVEKGETLLCCSIPADVSELQLDL